MKVCGSNDYSQLGEESNTDELNDLKCINLQCNSHLDISSLSSYSIYSEHSVFITKKGQGLAIGNNEGFRISASLPEDKIAKEATISLQLENGKSFKLLSAVCGDFYTFYLISEEKSGTNLLAYVSRNNTNPLFLNVNGHIHNIYLAAKNFLLQLILMDLYLS